MEVKEVKGALFLEMAEQTPTVKKSGLEKRAEIKAGSTKAPLSDPLDNFHVNVMLRQSPGQNMNSMATFRQARALLI
jgi:hypothetical protein